MANVVNSFDYKQIFNVQILSINDNFKEDIQKLSSERIPFDFFEGIQTLKGNGYNANGITSFSHLTKLAIAYFYECIFNDKVKDADYTIYAVKGYLDACNLTNFIPSNTLVGEYKELNKTPLFDACYLIIQTAYHYSEVFGKHQLLDYLNHYITTGEKLPDSAYNFDLNYLHTKYNDIERDKTKKGFYQNTKSYLTNWYYSSQELILNELQIFNSNFKQQKENEFRLYNSFAQCPRTLRYIQPVLLVGFDITGAYPSFIDRAVGSNLGKTIYDNLASAKNITRPEAKTLFNRALNSKKYRLGLKRDAYFQMLLDCGYTLIQANKILYEITDNPDSLFFDWASEIEQSFINQFKKENRAFNSTRVHDAIFLIRDKTIDYSKFNLSFENVSFDFQYYGVNLSNESFFVSNNKKPFRVCSFAPKGFDMATIHEQQKSDVKGLFNSVLPVIINQGLVNERTIEQVIDVTFYKESFLYLSCKFEYDALTTYDEVLNNFIISFNKLFFLNKKEITFKNIFEILQHYRKQTNLCFSIESMAAAIFDNISYSYKPTDADFELRDFSINRHFHVENDFAFMIALNTARGIISKKYLLEQIKESNENYFFKVENRVKDSTLKYIIDYLNINRVGQANYSKRVVSVPLLNNILLIEGQKKVICSEPIENQQVKTRGESKKTLIKKALNKSKAKELINYLKGDKIENQKAFELMQIDINDIKESIENIIALTNAATNLTDKPIIPIIPNIEYFETDLKKSIFFNKMPTWKDMVQMDIWQKGSYCYEFRAFHQEHTSWKLVQDLINNYDVTNLHTLVGLYKAKEMIKAKNNDLDNENPVEEIKSTSIIKTIKLKENTNNMEMIKSNNNTKVIRLAENTDFGIYGIDENEQYFFTPEQIKTIEGNNEYNQVKSLIIENFKGHFNILKYGY
jgi:hypothetical protein